MASPTLSSVSSLSDVPDLPEADIANDEDPNLAAFVSREKTPSSLLLKLKLPVHRLNDLLRPTNSISATASVQSSPPPSSPVASTSTPADQSRASKKRSGPKPKKTKIVVGEDGKPVEVLAISLAGPKLGPKSNAGAINDNLRALDRSGRPCRRWAKKSLTVRTLYGATWKTPGWIGQGQKVS